MTFALLYAYDERFVLPLSHDEVVHGKGSLLSKMGGDDWQRFAGAARAARHGSGRCRARRCVFMGAEMAPWQEWNDAVRTAVAPAGARRAPGRARRRPDDQRGVADEWPALWRRDDEPGGFQWLDADDADHSIYAFVRWDTDGADAVVCIANFTPLPATRLPGRAALGRRLAGRPRHRQRGRTGAAALRGLRGRRRHRRRVGRPVAVARDVRPTRHRPDVDALARQHRPDPRRSFASDPGPRCREPDANGCWCRRIDGQGTRRGI